MSEPPLLIHSLREFSSLILPALKAVEAQTILEIGSEAGTFTQELCSWAAKRGGSVTSIEPSPREAHRRLQREAGLRLIEGKSPHVLAGLPPFDAYIIDADHNYWCVSAELRHAFAQEDSPLVLIHDVAWPCARRDQYYDPADVPADERQPFDYDGGAVPDEVALVSYGGFRGEDRFAFACREGGPKNGVLTAVEDFLADESNMRFLRIPCIFGLGVLFRKNSPWASQIDEIIAPFHENTLLAKLERNRIDLLLRVIDPHSFHAQQGPSGAELIAAQQREIDVLEGELASLRLAAARQEI